MPPRRALGLLVLAGTVAIGSAALAVPVTGPGDGDSRRELAVCADPNNLPFSNRRLEGFENRLADIVAAELGATVRYTWWAQRRGFVRNTLKAGVCDVVLGVPVGWDQVSTTRPYYRSTYVFVTRRDRRLDIRSLDDPALARFRVGVQLIGNDAANAPPAHALARRGIVRNVVGYTVYGDYAQDNPPARIVDAVASGEVDVAIVWGPLGGYFAAREPVPLDVRPVTPAVDEPGLPFTFAIAMGVRKGDEALREALDRVLGRRQAEIDVLLDRYAVPRLPLEPAPRPFVPTGRRP
jgi:mxaJ protein